MLVRHKGSDLAAQSASGSSAKGASDTAEKRQHDQSAPASKRPNYTASVDLSGGFGPLPPVRLCPFPATGYQAALGRQV